MSEEQAEWVYRFVANYWKMKSLYVLLAKLRIQCHEQHFADQLFAFVFWYSIYFQNLAIVDIQSDPLELINDLKLQYPKIQIVYFVCDVTIKEEIESTFNEIESLFGTVDILINAAGIFNDKNVELTFKVNVVRRIPYETKQHFSAF